MTFLNFHRCLAYSTMGKQKKLFQRKLRKFGKKEMKLKSKIKRKAAETREDVKKLGEFQAALEAKEIELQLDAEKLDAALSDLEDTAAMERIIVEFLFPPSDGD